MNILLDSVCPNCGETATMELSVEAAAHDPQQLDIVAKCHFCNVTLNQFVAIDEMPVCPPFNEHDMCDNCNDKLRGGCLPTCNQYPGRNGHD
ncbi:TPA: hypothetical protein ON737_002903 [Morganella morganii]|nr:hypothetical protein [Morganella morganii]HCR3761894.1 hypothetical protein [Morganella morganii]HCT5326594.1 hypothetical protein [Morganella morganii]